MTTEEYVVSTEEDCFIGRVASVDTNRALILAESPEVIQTLTAVSYTHLRAHET